MFCKVERSYIEDGFNLYGLRACVANFSDCLDLILDRIGPDDSDDSHLTQSACTLYGLIHARYIITAHGLDAMYNKYANKEFGTCPLIQCHNQPVLPLGTKDEMGSDTVKIFCPKCQNVYYPPSMRYRTGNGSVAAHSSAAVDGAAFGTTFAHLFLMTFNNLVPDGLSQESAYVPRVFGFRVHSTARQRSGTLPGGNSGSNRRNNAAVAAALGITNGNGADVVENDAERLSLPQQGGMADKTGSKPAAAITDGNAGGDNLGSAVAGAGNDQSKGKKSKGRKLKSEDSGGGPKRRGKNGDSESNATLKNKRQRRP